MDKDSLNYLQKLLELSPNELNDNQVRFLRARRDYLTSEQVEKFKSIKLFKNATKEQKEEVSVSGEKEAKQVTDSIKEEAPVEKSPTVADLANLEAGGADPDYVPSK